MLPMGLGNATSTLVAQRIGAGDLRDARRLGWHGMQFTLMLALLVGSAVFAARTQVLQFYTDNPAVVAEAPLYALEAVEETGVLGRAWDSVRLWIK